MLVQITSASILGKVLRDIRKSRGLTQKDISEEVGLIQATISSFETSPERTKLDTLFKLLAALDLKLYVVDRKVDLHTEKADDGWDQEW
jgi:HTH-type transcriptional regulator/antitoxin HipB